MAHEHIDYAGRPQQKGPRRHLDGSGKEIIPKSELPKTIPAKGSLLKWGWQPSSLQAATAAKVKAAELAAKQKVLVAAGKVPLAPARYPGQPTTASNLEILKNRILGPQVPAVTPAPLLPVAPISPAQMILQQQEKQRLLFPKQTAVNQLNAQQQQAGDAVLNMFKQRSQQRTQGLPLTGWMGV